MSSSEEHHGFKVIDRRGEARVETMPEPVVPKAPIEAEVKSKRIWKNVGYMICPAQGPQGLLILGKACGLRQDGLSCFADYLFLPIEPEHFEWKKEARRRLNSFLGCDCTNSLQCHVHQIAINNWKKEDFERLEAFSKKPMPEAVEEFIKTATKQPNIVVPR